MGGVGQETRAGMEPVGINQSVGKDFVSNCYVSGPLSSSWDAKILRNACACSGRGTERGLASAWSVEEECLQGSVVLSLVAEHH